MTALVASALKPAGHSFAAADFFAPLLDLGLKASADKEVRMPFQPQRFERAVLAVTGQPLSAILESRCSAYAAAKTPPQKAQCVRELMAALDAEMDAETGQEVMARCACIGPGVIDRALAIQQEASDLDDLLVQLNAVHIGGGQLRLEDDTIHATYEHCYCGSVNRTRTPIPGPYCACSCGWYARLFEALLGRPVEVELLSSIIQGDPQCRFAIRIG